jgi:hypothetical protein
MSRFPCVVQIWKQLERPTRFRKYQEMSNYGGVKVDSVSETKSKSGALLAGIGAVSALLVVFAIAASHLSESKVCRISTQVDAAGLD